MQVVELLSASSLEVDGHVKCKQTTWCGILRLAVGRSSSNCNNACMQTHRHLLAGMSNATWLALEHMLSWEYVPSVVLWGLPWRSFCYLWSPWACLLAQKEPCLCSGNCQHMLVSCMLVSASRDWEPGTMEKARYCQVAILSVNIQIMLIFLNNRIILGSSTSKSGIHEFHASSWENIVIPLDLFTFDKSSYRHVGICAYLDNILKLRQFLLINLVGVGQTKVLRSLALQLLCRVWSCEFFFVCADCIHTCTCVCTYMIAKKPSHVSICVYAHVYLCPVHKISLAM